MHPRICSDSRSADGRSAAVRADPRWSLPIRVPNCQSAGFVFGARPPRSDEPLRIVIIWRMWIRGHGGRVCRYAALEIWLRSSEFVMRLFVFFSFFKNQNLNLNQPSRRGHTTTTSMGIKTLLKHHIYIFLTPIYSNYLPMSLQ